MGLYRIADGSYFSFGLYYTPTQNIKTNEYHFYWNRKDRNYCDLFIKIYSNNEPVKIDTDGACIYKDDEVTIIRTNNTAKNRHIFPRFQPIALSDYQESGWLSEWTEKGWGTYLYTAIELKIYIRSGHVVKIGDIADMEKIYTTVDKVFTEFSPISTFFIPTYYFCIFCLLEGIAIQDVDICRTVFSNLLPFIKYADLEDKYIGVDTKTEAYKRIRKNHFLDLQYLGGGDKSIDLRVFNHFPLEVLDKKDGVIIYQPSSLLKLTHSRIVEVENFRDNRFNTNMSYYYFYEFQTNGFYTNGSSENEIDEIIYRLKNHNIIA